MNKIIDFLTLCYNEYLDLIIAGVCIIAVIIFIGIVISLDKKKKNSEKKKEHFQEQSIVSLTPEEIEKISNNSADPDSVKITLTQEVTSLKEEKAKKKQSKPKTETKTEQKPKTKTKTKAKTSTKKAETKTETKVEETPKTEVKAKTETKVKTEPKTTTKKAATKTETKVEETPKTEVKAKTETKAKAEPKTTAKKATTKTETKQPTPASEDKKHFYTGKWKIKQDEQGFLAVLTASNGGTLLKTEYYKSLSGVKNGIETIKKNIDSGNFATSIDKYGHYRFKLFTSTNRLICVSEDYSSKAKCESGIESVKRFAQTASVIREDSDE